MTAVFSIFLLSLLVITAGAVIRATNLFVAVMLMGIFSLLIAASFFLLDAADVALTEAAVGAGISTVLFLSALAALTEEERKQASGRIAALISVSITGLLMAYATFYKPDFGDPSAPAHQHLTPWFMQTTAEQIDIPNVITAILASFRGYDTLGEVFVVLVAGIGVLFLLSAPRPASLPERRSDGLKHYLIPRMIGRLLIPFILLFGLYVQFHGEYGPGGGFQAGALIAAAVILYGLLEGQERALAVLPLKFLRLLMASGALLYAGVGVVGILKGSYFLDYSVLAEDTVTAQQVGIILIEAGVGMTVTGVLLSVYHAFVARGKPA
jgi:multicomponent Na+:H+ antiporter subunit B